MQFPQVVKWQRGDLTPKGKHLALESLKLSTFVVGEITCDFLINELASSLVLLIRSGCFTFAPRTDNW
jgi:hypothetical protein